LAWTQSFGSQFISLLPHLRPHPRPRASQGFFKPLDHPPCRVRSVPFKASDLSRRCHLPHVAPLPPCHRKLPVLHPCPHPRLLRDPLKLHDLNTHQGLLRGPCARTGPHSYNGALYDISVHSDTTDWPYPVGVRLSQAPLQVSDRLSIAKGGNLTGRRVSATQWMIL
jgi:hypothetical protein